MDEAGILLAIVTRTVTTNPGLQCGEIMRNVICLVVPFPPAPPTPQKRSLSKRSTSIKQINNSSQSEEKIYKIGTAEGEGGGGVPQDAFSKKKKEKKKATAAVGREDELYVFLIDGKGRGGGGGGGGGERRGGRGVGGGGARGAHFDCVRQPIGLRERSGMLTNSFHGAFSTTLPVIPEE